MSRSDTQEPFVAALLRMKAVLCCWRFTGKPDVIRSWLGEKARDPTALKRALSSRAPVGFLSGAGGFEPAAYVNLGVGFSAIMPGAGCVGHFFCPPVDGELAAVAVDGDPAHGIVALFTADFTTIDGSDHFDLIVIGPSGAKAPRSIWLLRHD
jgi:hypothetical protein